MARSKEFEVNEVLDKAMKIFWEQGYEKTSMSDLVEHMGIHRRSIYDTFDDKHSLFLQAMDRYRGKVSTTLLAEIKASKTAVEALHKIFEVMISEVEDTPSGCLIVNSAVELGTRDPDVDTRSLDSFNEAEQMFEQLIQWGRGRENSPLIMMRRKWQSTCTIFLSASEPWQEPRRIRKN